MLVVEEGGTVLEWYPEERILSVWFRGGPDLSGASARSLIAKATELVGDAPLGVLIDAHGVSEASLMWRLEWAEFFARRRGTRLAVHDIAPGLRVVFAAFVRMGGLDGRHVPDQETGLAWLLGAARPTPPTR